MIRAFADTEALGRVAGDEGGSGARGGRVLGDWREHGPVRGDGAGVEAVRSALEAAGPDAMVVVDLDETLLRTNSTERYLDAARPRLVAALVLAVLGLLRPWRWMANEGEGWDAVDLAMRDAWRVGVMRRVLPWIDRRWKGGGVGVMREHENAALVEALRGHPGPVVLATLGQRRVVEPMLSGCGLRFDGLVAGPDAGWGAWRAAGKAAAVRAEYGEEALAGAVVVTDSERDADLLDAAGVGVWVEWEGMSPVEAQSSVYLPLAYTSRVKRPAEREVVRQVFLDDYALLVLAIGLVNPWTAGNLLALTAGFLAFFCVYEQGYRENDRLGERYERRPNLSSAYRERPELRRGVGAWPWVWALGLACLAVWGLHAPFLGSGSAWSWGAAGWSMAGLMGLLIGTRLVFGVYNRVDVVTRVLVFPWLQVGKTFGFLVLLPTGLAGALFMAAQVVRRWLSYACYRAGGEAERLPSHTVRVMAYLVLAAGVVAWTGDLRLFKGWAFWVILGWLLLRGGRHVWWSVRGVRWGAGMGG
ncbi:MAG: haloacid dehalogenase-like hydrolase [Planctomycetota bacterium]